MTPRVNGPLRGVLRREGIAVSLRCNVKGIPSPAPAGKGDRDTSAYAGPILPVRPCQQPDQPSPASASTAAPDPEEATAIAAQPATAVTGEELLALQWAVEHEPIALVVVDNGTPFVGIVVGGAKDFAAGLLHRSRSRVHV